MNFKKWITVFFICTLSILCLYASYNALVDPFGIFGDKLLDYSEYSMTQNPRISKIGYLDRNYEKYDSYVIGCSKSSSLPTEALNRYFDANFYNMIMYGGDLYDIEKTAEYILENYGAENIVVVIGLEEARAYNTQADSTKGNLHAKVDSSPTIPFYLKYLFLNPEYSKNKLISYFNSSYLITSDEVFIPETGTYNKSRRDAARIPRINKYLEENPDFTSATWYNPIPDASLCVESLSRIQEACLKKGTSLTVIACPVFEKELNCYKTEEIVSYYTDIAEKVSFWNFSGYSTVTGEARYFYDSFHFRNCVGEMMLARIFSDDSVYCPEDFGQFVTKDNAEETLKKAFTKGVSEDITRTLPILMYHNFTEVPSSDGVSAERLDEHLSALENAGYTPVTLKSLEDFTRKGTPLPEKPILITIDDGYSSALDIAAPIFEKHQASAVISLIGCSIGKDTYKETDTPITPHFSIEEALPFVEKGTYTLISHTWDMHQVALDGEGYRKGVLQLETESEEEYLSALSEDLDKIRKAFSENGLSFNAVAYPYGNYSEISEVFYAENGIDVTFTTTWGKNEIVKGIPQTLRLLSRINVEDSFSGEMLIKFIESAG